MNTINLALTHSAGINTDEIISRAQELYRVLSSSGEKKNGKWGYSPVEEWKKAIGGWFNDPVHLKNFRRSRIASGTLNYPDRPKGELPDLWLGGLSWRQRIRGSLHIKRMITELKRYTPFEMKELNDTRIGNPWLTYYPPTTLTTEAQVRFVYYRNAIAKEFGEEFGNILEIGAGFGGLCGELLSSFSVNKYFIVDLPENLCLTYLYLSQLLDYSVPVVYDEDKVDIPSDAKVILIAPWMLPFLTEKVDLLVNTMSFQHMTMENLKYYFHHIERLNTKKMYLVNRNTKRDPTDVIIDDYPITSFKLVKDGTYLFSEHKERYYLQEERSSDTGDFLFKKNGAGK